jgi:predicted nuclease of predicted toxin-antitoxin system
MSYSFAEAESILKESTPFYGKINSSLKFLVDAQLPKKLSDFLNSKGFVSRHTLDLPHKNATTDTYIKEITLKEQLILITKDDDFLHSFLLEKKPSKLILIKTGNLPNQKLLEIFDKGLMVITSLIDTHPLIEITNSEIISHD